MGVLANSVSVTMTTSSDDDVSTGYLTGEEVTLSTNPAGTSYVWSAVAPSSSSSGRSALVGADGPSPKFVPDAAGLYLITCAVDGAYFYVLRISVTRLTQTSVDQALQLFPVTDSSVPAPAAGGTVYWSSDRGALCVKLSDGTVKTVTLA